MRSLVGGLERTFNLREIDSVLEDVKEAVAEILDAGGVARVELRWGTEGGYVKVEPLRRRPGVAGRARYWYVGRRAPLEWDGGVEIILSPAAHNVVLAPEIDVDEVAETVAKTIKKLVGEVGDAFTAAEELLEMFKWIYGVIGPGPYYKLVVVNNQAEGVDERRVEVEYAP